MSSRLLGIILFAATSEHLDEIWCSRPDLIDSALLRPGRLDKSLLCNMPDKEERKDVRSAFTLESNSLLIAYCFRFCSQYLASLPFHPQSILIHSQTLLMGFLVPTSKR